MSEFRAIDPVSIAAFEDELAKIAGFGSFVSGIGKALGGGATKALKAPMPKPSLKPPMPKPAGGGTISMGSQGLQLPKSWQPSMSMGEQARLAKQTNAARFSNQRAMVGGSAN
jgi:hypothetical protein